MAVINVTEFSSLAHAGRNQVVAQAGKFNAETKVTNVTATVSSVAHNLQKETRFVRLQGDVGFFVLGGTAGDSVSQTTGTQINGGVAEYFGVDGGQYLHFIE